MMSRSVYAKLYNHMLLPGLEYGDILYDSCTFYYKIKLNKVNSNVHLFAVGHLVGLAV